MKNKIFLISIILVALFSFGTTFGVLSLLQNQRSALKSQSVAVESIGSEILATGSIHSQNEATIHFQTAGKLVYLPVKEGDSVYEGETIAQLDTYPLQQQLTLALNNYRSTRDSFDQTQQNSQNGILNNTQHTALNAAGAGVGVYGTDNGTTNYINDVVKRIVDENQANLDNSVINVQLANYALQLATLTSPINGVMTHEDITVSDQNVTSSTSFSIADPTQLVFKANVLASDIDFIEVGSPATIKINGYSMPGIVAKIYPQKTTLSTGEEVYSVDVQSDNLQKDIAKLGQTGNVFIQSVVRQDSTVVPTWTVLGHKNIWVVENGKAMLKSITVRNTYGDKTEIGGLTPEDKVITNPAILASLKYQIL